MKFPNVWDARARAAGPVRRAPTCSTDLSRSFALVILSRVLDGVVRAVPVPHFKRSRSSAVRRYNSLIISKCFLHNNVAEHTIAEDRLKTIETESRSVAASDSFFLRFVRLMKITLRVYSERCRERNEMEKEKRRWSCFLAKLRPSRTQQRNNETSVKSNQGRQKVPIISIKIHVQHEKTIYWVYQY